MALKTVLGLDPAFGNLAPHHVARRPVEGALCRPACPEEDRRHDWEKACRRAAELFAQPGQLTKEERAK